jgi:hypothetical protein
VNYIPSNKMEDTMLKCLPICAALLALAPVSTSAKEQQAVLQKIEVPGSAFDILLALPTADGAVIDLSKSPEAFVVHLVGGELALAFESGEQMLQAMDFLRSPLSASSVRSGGAGPSVPVAAYIISKGGTFASAEK